jgi:hypothetical protein
MPAISSKGTTRVGPTSNDGLGKDGLNHFAETHGAIGWNPTKNHCWIF